MKRYIVYILLIMGLVFAAGCAGLDVHYDFDREVDFALIQTYDWMSVPKKTQDNELTLKHMKSAVNKQLQAKGLTVTSNNPDVLIAMHGGKEKKVDVQEWGYAYRDRDYYNTGPYYPYMYPTPYPVDPHGRENIEYRRGTDTYEYEVGTLIIDFVDAKKKELIWRGIATGVVDSNMTAEDIDRTVAKIMENYPPVIKK
jgi:Domain of unknown function (DUF4136)